MYKKSLNLLVYGFGHATVDALSAIVVFSLIFSNPEKLNSFAEIMFKNKIIYYK